MSKLVKINPVVGTVFNEQQEIWPVVLSALQRRNDKDAVISPLQNPAWDGSYFGLDQVNVFKEASENEQRAILWDASLNILGEASFIEQLGLAFNAKMILLTDKLEERTLYSLFAADEAQHLFWINAHMPPPALPLPQKPFFKLLSSIIEDGSKAPLTCLIQVLLEGWGINHYSSIAQDCNHVGLKTYLKKILKDEALHHGSGMILWNQLSLNSEEESFVIEMLVRLFEAVQEGPQMIVKSIERSLGHLSFAQKVDIFEQLKCEEQSLQRIDLLKSLLGKQNRENSVLSKLNELGTFRPYSATECAHRCV